MKHDKKTLIGHIADSNRKYLKEINDGRGWNHFGRAMVAKLLFFTFLYSLQKILLPVVSSYKIVSFLAGCGILVGVWEIWNRVLKEHCPEWIDDLMSGRIFFKLDITELNRYIAYLSFANLFLILLPKLITTYRLNNHEKN